MARNSTLTPAPVDANGRRLVDKGSQVIVDLRALDTDWFDLQFPVDIKGLSITVTDGTISFDGVVNCSLAWLDNDDVTNNEDGTVTIPAAAHGFAHDGTAYCDIGGTDNYDGTDVNILSASDADNLVITATYVAEEIQATAYAVGRRYPTRTTTDQPLVIPVAVEPFTTILSMKAATTGTVSIVAWR